MRRSARGRCRDAAPGQVDAAPAPRPADGDPSQRLFEETLGDGGTGRWGFRLGDAFVAAGTLVVALAAALVLWFGYGVQGVPGVADGTAADGGDGASDATAEALYAVVQNTEGYYAALPLDEDATLTVESSLGTNVIEVRGGQVRCAESDCSNQVCVDTGWVSQTGQMIVCLPHQLTVQIVPDPADAAPLV